MRFVTVPVTGTPTIDGASVVTLDLEKTADLFDALESDRFEDWFQGNSETIDGCLPPARCADRTARLACRGGSRKGSAALAAGVLVVAGLSLAPAYADDPPVVGDLGPVTRSTPGRATAATT